jgi:hypothetical protein
MRRATGESEELHERARSPGAVSEAGREPGAGASGADASAEMGHHARGGKRANEIRGWRR